MFCKRFELITKSDDDWENKVIEYFFEKLQNKDHHFPKTRILRIEDQGAPDFYSLGFDAVLEIKKVTDSEEKSGKYAGSKNGLDRLTKEVNESNPYKDTFTSAHIIIPGGYLIKNKGKDYERLRDDILESLRNRSENGFSRGCIYRIEYIENIDLPSVLIPIQGMDIDHLNYKDLKEPIKLRIEKANKQLAFVPGELTEKYLRILILCKYGTRSQDPNDIKQNVCDLQKEIPEIFQNIDRIYILAENYFELIELK